MIIKQGNTLILLCEIVAHVNVIDPIQTPQIFFLLLLTIVADMSPDLRIDPQGTLAVISSSILPHLSTKQNRMSCKFITLSAAFLDLR